MTVQVRAKFWVKGVVHHHNGSPVADQSVEIVMAPVFGTMGSGNESWAKYTPQGEIKMLINNPSAAAKFELGKQYFVDFTPAEPAA